MIYVITYPCRYKISSGEWWPFCPGPNVFIHTFGTRGSLPASSTVTSVRVATIYAPSVVATRTVRTRAVFCTNGV